MPEGKIPRLKQGWLFKQGGRVKNWKRRYFVLDTNSRLAYYLSEADAQAGVHQLGIVNVQKALYITPRSSSLKDTTIFWPSHVPPDTCFTVITQDRTYGVYSDTSAEDCRTWIKALKECKGEKDSNGQDDGLLQPGGMRPRLSTIGQMQLDQQQSALSKRYHMDSVPPNAQVVFCKWHRVLEATLASLGAQFGTKPYTLVCNMGELYEKTTKLKNRLGELVFGDYADELRYNLGKEMGDHEMGRQAFVAATEKKTIRLVLVDSLPDSAPNRTSIEDGVILMEVKSSQLGKGVHLMGKGLVTTFKALGDKPVCGGSLQSLPLAHALNVCRAEVSLNQSLTRLAKALQASKQFSFKCDYQVLHKAAVNHGEVQQHMGDTIVCNIAAELCAQLVNHAHTGKGSNLPAKLESLLNGREIVFSLRSENNTVEAEVNGDGVLHVSTNLDKLHELTVYERIASINLKPILEQAATVGTSI